MPDSNRGQPRMLANLRVEPGLQRRYIHVSALGQRYERFGHFAMIAVGYANHQRFADGWMVIENFLDLAREYLEHANSNHVLKPVDDANVAIPITQAHVSGAQTFAEEHRHIAIRAIQITMPHIPPQ